MSEEEKLLAAEMAAVSAAKSTEIVEAASTAGELNAFQNKLDDAADRVLEAKKVLGSLQAFEVTPEIVADIDRTLVKAGVTIPAADGMDAVEGAEALGITLMPKDYLFTRLLGCESFLNDFFRDSKEVVQRIGSAVKDIYIGFTESQESLSKQLDLLENQILTTPEFNSSETFILGHRLYNLLKVNGKVDQNWAGNLSKLATTLQGLTGNYYLSSKKDLQTVYSYFGGFSGATLDQSQERLMMLPVSIPSTPFKECTYPNNSHGGPNLIAKQSVELMGGAYFVDVRQKARPVTASSIDEVKDFMIRFLEHDHTSFETYSEYTLKDVGFEIKALSSKEIKAMIRQLRDIMGTWQKIFEAGEKFRMNDNDYNDVVKGLLESELSDEMKVQLSKWFGSIVRKNQMELLTMRAQVSTYLTFIINGLIDICKDSIKVSAP
jgi:hypothetical protein